MKLLSRILISCGTVLLAIWALARIHSEVASSVALAQLPPVAAIGNALPAAAPADAPAAAAADAAEARVDTSLWSEKRVAEFKKLLGMSSEPPVAVVQIPRLGLEAPVFRGTDDVTLNRGVGWIAGTAEPGSNGNAGIAGHRDSFFRGLKDIAVGDAIELRTRAGVKQFVVRELTIVKPTDVEVLAPTAEPTLTFVTCYPFYYVGSAPQRFIVRAVAPATGGTATPAAADR